MAQAQNQILRPDFVNDRGPIYAETLLDFDGIVEPLNALSNILFLVIIFYWVRRTKLRVSESPLIVLALPVLMIGFVGGTLYHATRSSNLWLFMDFIPILLLTFAAAVRLWKILWGNYWRSLLCCLLLLVLPRFFIFQLELPISLRIAMGYSLAVLLIIFPALIIARRMRWAGAGEILCALLFFTLAISFRSWDLELSRYFQHGSHFLWHIFGALAAQCLMLFLHRIRGL